MKRRGIVLALGLWFTVSLVGVAAAQNTIMSGLQQGINAATGSTGGVNAPTNRASRPVSSSNTASSNLYVALGDSVAAGAGLPVVANATTQDALCHRSSQAYPFIVAQRPA